MNRVIPVFDDVPEAPSGVRGRKPRAGYGEEVHLSSLRSIPVLLIEWYQKRTVDRPHMCTCYPTCSEYTKQAIIKYGFFKGGWLGFKRICRCHPLNEGGYDPVP